MSAQDDAIWYRMAVSDVRKALYNIADGVRSESWVDDAKKHLPSGADFPEFLKTIGITLPQLCFAVADAWLNTPEKGGAAFARARDNAEAFLNRHGFTLDEHQARYGGSAAGLACEIAAEYLREGEIDYARVELRKYDLDLEDFRIKSSGLTDAFSGPQYDAKRLRVYDPFPTQARVIPYSERPSGV